VTNKEFVDKSLADLDLVPAILLNFFWVSDINRQTDRQAER
jgi:hypothetical protein